MNTADLLNLSNKKLTDISEDLLKSCCPTLHRLNLSQNELERAAFTDTVIELIPKTLTWLQLNNNKLDNVDFITSFPELKVINLGGNQLKEVPVAFRQLRQLRAVILNNNQLMLVKNLEKLKDLNTLVLSNNEISKISGLDSLSELTKLSLAHNKLMQFPNLVHKKKLKEIRLNDNQIATLPDSVAHLDSLEILELGNNQIKSISDIEVLAKCSHLRQLNLRGNPIADLEDFVEKVRAVIPSLRCINGEWFDKRHAEKKEGKNQVKRAPTEEKSVPAGFQPGKKIRREHRHPTEITLRTERKPYNDKTRSKSSGFKRPIGVLAPKLQHLKTQL